MYPSEYIEFLAHFHGDRDYFECHEILENYWKKVGFGNKNSIWVGFIQLAVSSYHHRRANFKGAKRMLEKALKIFSIHEDSLRILGLDKQLLNQMLKERLSDIEKEVTYKSLDLPIFDPHLVEECTKACEQKGFKWGCASNMSNINLVHRHKLRDRTCIIQERNHSLNVRKGNG